MIPSPDGLRAEPKTTQSQGEALRVAEREAASVLVPFGKHKGRSLGWIAQNDLLYLDWLVDVKVRSPTLRAAVETVWKKHKQEIADLVRDGGD
jgi:hypothetical protein